MYGSTKIAQKYTQTLHDLDIFTFLCPVFPILTCFQCSFGLLTCRT